MSSMRSLVSVFVLSLCGFGLVGCTGGGSEPGGGQTPADARQVLQQAATAMGSLKSVGVRIATEGTPPVPVKSGDVKLLKNGDAQGTLAIQQFGLTVQTDFVLVGDALYYKGLTGKGYQKASRKVITSYYDPSALLDPERGITRLLTLVQAPKVEGTEKVNGKDAYKVHGRLPKASISGLIPGIDQDLDGYVWVARDDHRLVRVRGDVVGGQKGAVILDFTEFDAGYSIKAPA